MLKLNLCIIVYFDSTLKSNEFRIGALSQLLRLWFVKCDLHTRAKLELFHVSDY
jgi:hypothetical protein